MPIFVGGDASPQSLTVTSPPPPPPTVTSPAPQSPTVTSPSPQLPTVTSPSPQSPTVTSPSPKSPMMTAPSPESPTVTSPSPESLTATPPSPDIVAALEPKDAPIPEGPINEFHDITVEESSNMPLPSLDVQESKTPTSVHQHNRTSINVHVAPPRKHVSAQLKFPSCSCSSSQSFFIPNRNEKNNLTTDIT